MNNTLLRKFKEHQVSVGTLSHLRSSTVIESLGYVGLDFLMVDEEHTPAGIDEIAGYLTASSAAGLPMLVRVNAMERSAVLRVLDAGAAGVIVPGVETVEQVQRLVKYAKFKPLGDRGYCMTRDGGWGRADNYQGGIMDYMASCNADTMLIPQCETVSCLAHIEEITAMEGVDGIMVGPFDLSIDMGIPGQFQDAKFREALEKILRACRKNGKLCMIFAGDAAKAKAYMAQGFDSILLGIDVLVLTESYKKMLDELS